MQLLSFAWETDARFPPSRAPVPASVGFYPDRAPKFVFST